MRNVVLLLVAFGCTIAATAFASTSPDASIPHYDHIFVIMEENKDYGQIIGSKDAPTITALARRYGSATNFYAEAHPSEPNYVALVSGDTFGIRDDKPHALDAPNLAGQLESAGLTWKNYNESIPEPGSLVASAGLYAQKHSGFAEFLSVQHDPHLRDKLVGFDQLTRDLQTGSVPNFSLIIPNICNEMHGESAADAPEGCSIAHASQLIWRGDDNVRRIVGAIVASSAWKAAGNAAIVVTFDENDSGTGAGGGHIATVVVTNHGPRGVTDATPYTHYSLLRTIEDAFGLRTYLGHAADATPMVPLFKAGG